MYTALQIIRIPTGQYFTEYDRQGNLIPSAKFTFWSSDTSIARVSREFPNTVCTTVSGVELRTSWPSPGIKNGASAMWRLPSMRSNERRLSAVR